MTLLQGEELVAQIDKGRSAALAPKFEIEQSTVERQSLFNAPTSSAMWLKPTARAFLASAMALSSSSSLKQMAQYHLIADLLQRRVRRHEHGHP